MSEPVLVSERRGNVQILRLNRPEARNALSSELVSAVGLGIEVAENDDDVRCVVLTGTGDRAFCAGMDLRGFAAGAAPTEDEQRGAAVYGRFIRGDVAIPVVGAANASAVAGGFELLLACDMVVASEDARFGLPEVKRGLFPAGGGVFLSRRIPMAIALELCLTGDPVDAARACSLGLVNQVVPAGEVLAAAVALAERIANNGPLAVAATKRLVRSADVDTDATWQLQAELMPAVFESADAKEGATAFIERREPVWTGR